MEGKIEWHDVRTDAPDPTREILVTVRFDDGSLYVTEADYDEDFCSYDTGFIGEFIHVVAWAYYPEGWCPKDWDKPIDEEDEP